MTKFNKRFVHFMWSDELEGKEVFYSDNMMLLVGYVNDNNRGLSGEVSYSSNDSFPFSINGDHWRFVYYDPNYATKLAAEQGKKIECKRKGDAWGDLDWDYTPSPEWLDDHEYRIMPEEQKPVTNRELSKWLAQGNGECYLEDDSGWHTACRVEWEYTPGNESKYVCDVMVRKWEDKVWHKLTREYLGLEE